MEGPFFLQVEFSPENDLCMDAVPVGEGTIMGILGGSSTGACGSNDQWYTYTASAPGTLQVTTCGTNDLGGIDAGADTVLGIYAACPIDNADNSNLLDCNDDDITVCNQTGLFRDSVVSVDVTQGATYFISVSPFGSGDQGEAFILNVELTAMFTDVCIGDGGDQFGCTDCPCGNNASPGTIGGCLNSASDSARLTLEGSNSLTTSDLSFEMSGGTPDSFAILTSGSGIAPGNPANPCFAQNPGSGITSNSLDGLRCRIGTVFRHGSRAIDAAGFVGPQGPPPGGFWNTALGNVPNYNFAPGEQRYFQVFYREIATAGCMTGLNTSQAVEVTFAP